MDVVETITHPWREPVDYIQLVIAVVIFLIVAFAVMDMLRILAAFIKASA
jgi:preprotein translocase subunit SecE